LTVFAITICITTLFLFPIIGYSSLAFYGLPAAVFLLLGYVVGINIFSTNQKMGIAFAVGFIPPVAFFLLILLPGAPLSIVISLLPVTASGAFIWFEGESWMSISINLRPSSFGCEWLYWSFLDD